MRRSAAVFAFVALATSARIVRAAEPEPQDLFREATEALAAERLGDAVAKLEALGDRGVVDAVVSFDRGIAYASRARTSAAQPGDLGRAVHGFEEARELSRDGDLDDDAKRALGSIRTEIARRRARAGESAELAIGASLGRALVELASENTWAALAAVASLVLSIAILARARASLGRAKVAANTTIGIAGAALVAFALLASGARDVRLHVREAVVVSPGTRLLDARKIVVGGRDPLAEGARVTLVEEEGGFSHIRAGTLDGWVSQTAVLPLAKRR